MAARRSRQPTQPWLPCLPPLGPLLQPPLTNTSAPLCQPSERSLLTMLVARLRAVDADVFVGHNFAAFDLDVLLHRMQHHKVRWWGWVAGCMWVGGAGGACVGDRGLEK